MSDKKAGDANKGSRSFQILMGGFGCLFWLAILVGFPLIYMRWGLGGFLTVYLWIAVIAGPAAMILAFINSHPRRLVVALPHLSELLAP